MKVHHIGYLVKDIRKSITAFELLGYKIAKEPVWDPGRVADICFLENDGYCVELIAPTKDSTLYSMLKQYNNAPYHMCYCCENIEETIEKLKKEKFMLFLQPENAPAIGRGAKVAFLMNARAGMIELVSQEGD